MCAPEVEEIKSYHDGFDFYAEGTYQLLDSNLVALGCEEELKRFDEMQVYQYVKRQDVPDNSNIVNVRWVHVNKGSAEEPVVRCRLVAQEFNDGNNKDELFAGTPPLYIIRMMMSMFASSDNHCTNKLMILDVKGAFLYGNAKRDIYIELPPEDTMSRSGHYLGKLRKGDVRDKRCPADLAGGCRDQDASVKLRSERDTCISLFSSS